MAEPLEALIPKTQEQLQPLIGKPKLADKLLMKPPFRFLHDIFTALIASSGFAKGLYNDFEMNSANMKEKHQKTTYLDKMIVCVGQTLGKDIDVRSAKIVAGLEPENTNVFLQELARAASNSSFDWTKAVQKTLEKIPSLTADAAAPAEAKDAKEAKEAPAPSERPSSKDESKAKEKAEAEAKAKEKAKRDKEIAEQKEREQKAEVQRREYEQQRAQAEAKAQAQAQAQAASSAPSSAESKARSKPSAKPPASDNNTEVDDGLAQQIKDCNGDFDKTKDIIEKIISKPKMAVKLLSKPPFRFIHDIVSEITRVTGFATGLYTDEELDSNNIKEKQPKIDYLTKIIQCVSVHLNVEIEAKPAKIVAGLEPEDTNKFLQLLALACKTSQSSTDTVKRVLAGDTTLREASKKAAKAEREATPEAKLSSRSTTPQETKKPKDHDDDERSAAPTITAATAATAGFSGPMKPLALKGDDDDERANLRFDAKGTDDDDAPMVAPGTSGGLGTSRTSRPTTARRRPPKLKENVTEVGRLLVHDTKVAPVVGIMKDGDNADSDDDSGGADDGLSSGRSNNSNNALLDDGGAHGRLVRDILKDQTAAEEAARKQKEDEDTQKDGPSEVETGIRLGRRKKSFKDKSKSAASSVTEMNELRHSIQKICQAANPIGKCVEFVHEDLEAMSKELEKWKKEYEKKREVYEDERKKTEDALQPLQVQLLEVEEQIKEQIHKINTVKATIAKNEEKTQKLLRMVVSA